MSQQHRILSIMVVYTNWSFHFLSKIIVLINRLDSKDKFFTQEKKNKKKHTKSIHVEEWYNVTKNNPANTTNTNSMYTR